jgi:hypothetical protein
MAWDQIRRVIMPLTGQFFMSRDQIVAVSMTATNYSESPYASTVFQLRRLLNL